VGGRYIFHWGVNIGGVFIPTADAGMRGGGGGNTVKRKNFIVLKICCFFIHFTIKCDPPPTHPRKFVKQT
jgi:hypothetical protein